MQQFPEEPHCGIGERGCHHLHLAPDSLPPPSSLNTSFVTVHERAQSDAPRTASFTVFPTGSGKSIVRQGENVRREGSRQAMQEKADQRIKVSDPLKLGFQGV